MEGSLVLDSQPAANERIVAGNHVTRYDDAGRRFGFMSFYLETKTDSSGRFSFDKVPPGQCSIFRQQRRARTGFESHETSVVVNAGAVTQVVLGGGGRTMEDIQIRAIFSNSAVVDLPGTNPIVTISPPKPATTSRSSFGNCSTLKSPPLT